MDDYPVGALKSSAAARTLAGMENPAPLPRRTAEVLTLHEVRRLLLGDRLRDRRELLRKYKRPGEWEQNEITIRAIDYALSVLTFVMEEEGLVFGRVNSDD